MPHLLRKMARTAVVAGAATVSRRISSRQTGRWSEEAEPDAYAEEQLPEEQLTEEEPAEEQPPADDMSRKIEQLRQLGELKEKGLLNDAEFEQQKTRVLGN